MRCFKCNGVMVREKFYDADGDGFNGWRCINCGVIIDPIIMENARIQALRVIHDFEAIMELETRED